MKSVSILAGGAALARVIPILVSPVLTRIYTPADFGMFAVFMALVSSFVPAACGKYEVAIVLPESPTDAMRLLGISFLVTITVSLLIQLGLFFGKDELLRLLNAEHLGGWIYLTPLVLLCTGLMTAMTYFANRHGDYRSMANARIVNSIIVAVVSIVFGVLSVGYWGLLLGSLLGLLSATLYLLYLYRKQFSKDLLIWDRNKAQLMKQYSDYPLYNASTGLLNGVTAAMPVFFLSHFFPGSIVGYFSFVLRVVNLPLSLISKAVSEVNLKKIVDLVNTKEDLKPYLLKLTLGLAAIVLMPTIILMIFSPSIFSFCFGEEWREAGIYMKILIPAIAVRFVISTVSTTLDATQNNSLGAIWKVTSFVVTFVVFMLFAPRRDAITLFKAVVLMDIALYLFYFLFIWRAAGRPRNRILQADIIS